MPPAAVGATQRLAEEVLRRAADRWPQLGKFVGVPHRTDTWRPPAWPEDDTDRVLDHVVATSTGSQPPSPSRWSSIPPQSRVPEIVYGETQALIERAGSATSWGARRDAVRQLAGLPGSEVGEALLAALSDSAAEVASAGVEAIAAWAPVADERVTRALVEVLSSEHGFHDPLVRSMAAGALGKRLARDAGEPLLDAVGDASAEVSVAAMFALAEGGFEGTEARLLEVLEEPSGFYVPLTRRAAARGLAMLDTLDHDRVARVRLLEQDDDVRAALPEPPE